MFRTDVGQEKNIKLRNEMYLDENKVRQNMKPGRGLLVLFIQV